MPPKRYKVMAKVISQQGKCNAGMKVGDEWLIDRHTPTGMCISAFYNAYPNIRALMLGAQMPMGDNPNVTTSICPDANNPVKLELRRVMD